MNIILADVYGAAVMQIGGGGGRTYSEGNLDCDLPNLRTTEKLCYKVQQLNCLPVLIFSPIPLASESM
jgi:hypothetical protein